MYPHRPAFQLLRTSEWMNKFCNRQLHLSIQIFFTVSENIAIFKSSIFIKLHFLTWATHEHRMYQFIFGCLSTTTLSVLWMSQIYQRTKKRGREMRRIMMIIYWPTLRLLFYLYDCTINLRGRTGLWSVVLSVPLLLMPLSFSKSLKLQRAVVTFEYVACDKRD